MKHQKFPWEDEALDPPLPHNTNLEPKNTENPKVSGISDQRAGRSRTSYPTDLRLAATLGALKETMTQSQLSELFGVPQPQISLWKRNAIESIRMSIINNPKGKLKAPQARNPVSFEQAQADRECPFISQLVNMLRTTADLLERVPHNQADAAIQYPED
jgi:transposase-like protein